MISRRPAGSARRGGEVQQVAREYVVEQRTRLPRAQPRVYRFEYADGDYPSAVEIEASVRYHLLTEARRKRIEYANKDPIAYDVYRARIALNASQGQGLGHE